MITDLQLFSGDMNSEVSICVCDLRASITVQTNVLPLLFQTLRSVVILLQNVISMHKKINCVAHKLLRDSKEHSSNAESLESISSDACDICYGWGLCCCGRELQLTFMIYSVRAPL